MVKWVHEVGFIRDINEYAHEQWAEQHISNYVHHFLIIIIIIKVSMSQALPCPARL
jgi:hypothetical protein